MTPKNSLRLSRVLAGALGMIASGCSSSVQHQVQVTMPKADAAVQAAQTAARLNMKSSSSLVMAGVDRAAVSAPNSFDGFACFGLNVTGSGIARDERADSFCPKGGAALGTLGGLASFSGGSVAISVTGGTARTIQLLGVMTSDGTCPAFDQLAAFQKQGGIALFYKIGETQTDVLADVAVSIQGKYDPLKPIQLLKDCASDVIGPPAKLLFSVQPSASGVAGTIWSAQPAVSVQDAGGHLVPTATDSITLGAFTDATCTTPATGTLSTNITVSASKGVALFSGLSHTLAASIYLKASAPDLASDCSQSIMLAPGPGAQLGFDVQPSATATAAVAFGVQPKVAVRDINGNTVLSSNLSVTLAAFSDATCATPIGGGVVLGATTNPVIANKGVASFAGVNQTLATTVYLQASATGLTSACSTATVISPDAPAKLIFATQPPAAATATSAFGTQPVVVIQDVSNNVVVSANNSITLNAYTDATCSTPTGGSLSATNNPMSATSGSAAFAGVGHTLATTIFVKATSSGLTSACSSGVTIAPGAASKLIFSVQPSASAVAGIALGVQPMVKITDSSGNQVFSATNPVTLSAFTNNVCTAAASGTLNASTNPLNAAAGVANFSNVSHTFAAGLYFKASSGVLTSACSSLIVVAPGAFSLSQSTVTVASPSVPSGLTDDLTLIARDSYANPILTGGLTIVFSHSGGTSNGNIGATVDMGNGTYRTQFTSTTVGSPTNILATINGASVVSTPPQITVLSPLYLSISSGTSAACAVGSNQSVYCWGNNSVGNLGNNTTSSSSTPVQVLGVGGTGFLNPVTQVAQAGNSACAVKSDNTVYCWGSGTYGQLGINTTPPSQTTPVQVHGVSNAGNLTGIAKVSMSSGATVCALSTGGTATYCWGNGGYGQLGINAASSSMVPAQVVSSNGSGALTGILDISVGNNHACAVVSSGDVYCWGDNSAGQIGDNTVTQRNYPTLVSGVSNVISMSAGDHSTCAVNAGGNVYCWGRNNSGQIGDNTTTDRHTPTQVVGVGAVSTLGSVSSVSLSTGSSQAYSCAVKADGSAYCWGYNGAGTFGNNTATNSSTPVQVKDPGGAGILSSISQFSAGDNAACAVNATGSAYCWGMNTYGQIGNGNTTQSMLPVPVLGAP